MTHKDLTAGIKILIGQWRDGTATREHVLACLGDRKPELTPDARWLLWVQIAEAGEAAARFDGLVASLAEEPR